MEVHHGHDGYYIHYPEGFRRKSVTPPACGWHANKNDAELEALRLANLTGDAFLVVVVVSKVVPWHQPCN